MGHQSLYRRYRSQTFAEIKGQPVVTNALRTAVAEGRHGHAYLFSGPRGTGKTSTARVLAKALNCENPTNGEPDGTCDSCRDIEAGRSFDLHELDAASNNKVDDIRELINRVALGSPGRTKVYILDEVHMLSSGAENALLKTLEEPPEHVVFVLATTEPQKVVPTIRSRTQHFRFQLLPAAELEEHVRWVIADAGLDVDDDGIAWALKTGGGSARDTLSALDLVVASGGAPDTATTGADLCRAIADRDPAAAIAAMQRGLEAGSEPRIIGEDMLGELRSAFLASMQAPLTHLNDAAADRAAQLAAALGPATITRSLEKIGEALVEVRQAPDPRVPIEVALLQLARAEGDDTAALLQRIEALESKVAELSSKAPPSAAAPGAAPPPAAPPPRRRRQPAEGARGAMAGAEEASKPVPKRSAPPAEPSRPPDEQPVSPPTGGGELTLGNVEARLPDILQGLTQQVRARFRQGRPTRVENGTVTFAYPNQLPADRASQVKGELEVAMSAHFNTSVQVDVVVDPSRPDAPRRSSTPPAPPASESEDDIGPVSELQDAEDSSNTMVERLTAAFPGAKLIDPPTNT
ncbi:MAG: DNA polymerase III subunit gamma/tau [Acidimicrobiales bacterium]|nr:DNA polymerase III subunit gamma/tau [Acidimicrobiales bacterium]